MTANIALVNLNTGEVEGHKAGCADLTRGHRKHSDEVWEFEVDTKAEAWFSYNSDFLSEGGEDNAYEIKWFPCAKHVPEGDQHALYVEAFETPAEPTPAEPVTEVKQGTKWTYVYVNGQLVAEIRNDQAHLLAAIV